MNPFRRGLILSCVLACLPTWGQAATYYVWTDSPANGPGTEWSNAFHAIQAAVDVATNAGDLVLVTNGVYATGGTNSPVALLTNRVFATNAITVESVNGPESTVILGQGPPGETAIRCAYLGGGAVLSGFTLSNGCTRVTDDEYADQSGGGVYAADRCSIVSNCVITGNQANKYGGGVEGGVVWKSTVCLNVSAETGGGTDEAAVNQSVIYGNSSQWGGGTWGGPVNNSVIRGNVAAYGGGWCVQWGEAMSNCTVVGNTGSSQGGGIYSDQEPGVFLNCIVYYNSAPRGENVSGGTYQYNCTVPDPGGAGNITSEPGFVDYGAWDLRLSSSSMCINAGNNEYSPGERDVEGNERIRASVIDMGAYESPYAPIDAWCGLAGSIAPSGRVGLLVSNDQAFAISVDRPLAGVKDVKIDGISIGVTNSYTFYSVTSNHTIEALFWAYPDTNGYEIAQTAGETAGELVLRWQATNGWLYTLQQTPTLLPVAWSNVVPLTNMPGPGEIVITNDTAAAAIMFYRVVAIEQE